MTLCEKLTQARKAAGLTQADVAAKLNVSRQAVSRWESGQSKPSTEKLLALGALYGVSIDQLLNAEESVVEAVSDEPEAVPVEPVIPQKHRSRTWWKYAAAVLCGALLMLAIILSLKTPNSSEKSIDARKLNDMEADYVGNVQKTEKDSISHGTENRLKWAFMGGNTNEKVLSAFRIHTACIEPPPAERLFFAFP